MTALIQDLAKKIDHTLLKPDATQSEIQNHCQEALEYHFAGVCVNSSYIRLIHELLQGSDVKPIAVIGFPLGAMSSTAKAFEAREAVLAGAQEIDMVLDLGALKSQNYQQVFQDIQGVVEITKPLPVKVILETSSLNEDQKMIAAVLAQAAGAQFIKTSTGFGSGGATVEDVILLRRVIGPSMQIKASGGIRSLDQVQRLILAGADRIGTSSSVKILQEERQKPLISISEASSNLMDPL